MKKTNLTKAVLFPEGLRQKAEIEVIHLTNADIFNLVAEEDHLYLTEQELQDVMDLTAEDLYSDLLKRIREVAQTVREVK